MAEFSSSFTGKGVTARLEGSTSQSYAGLGDTIKEIENIRYETFQKNKAEFLKNANIDPAFVLSKAAQETQMKLIDNFNKKYGELARKRNYNLTTEDRLAMQTDRNLIEAVKNEQLAQQEMFRKNSALIEQYPNRYSREGHIKDTEDYFDSGKYLRTAPPLKPLPPEQYIRGLVDKMKGVNPQEVVEGTRKGIKTTAFETDGQAEDFVQSALLSSDQHMLGALDEWSRLPQTEKETYFKMADENNDKVISEAESQNAIMMWMRKRYTPVAMTPKYGGWNNIATTKSDSEIGVNLGGTTVKLNPGNQRAGDVPYGNTVYTQPYSFGSSKAVINIPVEGGRKHRGTVTVKMLGKGSMRGQLLEYDPAKDVLVVRSIASNSALGLDSQDAVEVPASNLEGVDNIPIMIGDRQATLGEIRNKTNTQPTVKKTNSSGLVWKK